VLVAIYVTFEAPLSGMSMNPARTLGSAFQASYWHSLWIYFIAPALGMLIAAELFLRVRKGAPPRCAKLYHTSDKRCIFRCGYRSQRESYESQGQSREAQSAGAAIGKRS
jgi:aquaporin Z